ncbi:hypothetical protein Tco_0201524 [Tanacetum coccineum]
MADEYELRIRKKGYILQDIWDKCGEVCDKTFVSWYKDEFEEEEKWECSIDGIHYDPPRLIVNTYEVKWYSFGHKEHFVCVKMKEKEELMISKMNGEKFKREIRREIVTTGCVSTTKKDERSSEKSSRRIIKLEILGHDISSQRFNIDEMPMYTLEFSPYFYMPTVHEDFALEEVQASKKKMTKRLQSKKVVQDEVDQCVNDNDGKKDAFYMAILAHMHKNCPITKHQTYDMINKKWKIEVRRPMDRDIARKKAVASSVSSTSGYEDALAWLMVNEYADLTQTYKERKSKNIETFIVIRKREVELRIQETGMREVVECRQGLQFYLQPHDHLDGQ